MLLFSSSVLLFCSVVVVVFDAKAVVAFGVVVAFVVVDVSVVDVIVIFLSFCSYCFFYCQCCW